MPQTLDKQPQESRLYDMDFSPRLAPEETILSVISVTERAFDDEGERVASNDLTFGTPTHDGEQMAQVRISGGIDGKLYEITFLVETSLGNTVEAEGYLCVRDV